MSGVLTRVDPVATISRLKTEVDAIEKLRTSRTPSAPRESSPYIECVIKRPRICRAPTAPSRDSDKPNTVYAARAS